MRKQVAQAIQSLAFLTLLSLWCSGCAHYQYAVVQPANLAQTIEKKPVRVDYPPLVYQFQVQEQRLLMQINNPTDSPITMLGQKSYLVDPKGQSHPLRGGIIAPRSFIGMVFPPGPPPARFRPSFGVGLGFGGPRFGPAFHSGVAFYDDPFYYGPPDGYPPMGPRYWAWKTGDVRLSLFYQQLNPANNFEHQFLFERRKVK